MGYSPWGCKESDTKNNLATRGASLVAQMVKNLTAVWETRV